MQLLCVLVHSCQTATFLNRLSHIFAYVYKTFASAVTAKLLEDWTLLFYFRIWIHCMRITYGILEGNTSPITERNFLEISFYVTLFVWCVSLFCVFHLILTVPFSIYWFFFRNIWTYSHPHIVISFICQHQPCVFVYTIPYQKNIFLSQHQVKQVHLSKVAQARRAYVFWFLYPRNEFLKVASSIHLFFQKCTDFFYCCDFLEQFF